MCEKSESLTIIVCVGEPAREYQGGNFLNAIDEVASYFCLARTMDIEEIKKLLAVYAEREG
jgi:hypothetical protein